MKDVCSHCFKNLGVKSRLSIFKYIEENKRANVSEITEHVKLKQPTVSYHLKEMQETGLLNREEKGKEVFYLINNKCPHDGAKCFFKD